MKSPDYLYLNSRDEFYRIDLNNIVYFEADGNYTRFAAGESQKGIVGYNLLTMQALLKERLGAAAGGFARTGKRHIINLNYVYHISILRQELTLSDGRTFAYRLSVSKEALRNLRSLFVTAAESAVAPQPLEA